MKRALFLTAYNRPHYLASTLASWREVRGLHDWRVVFRVEPSEVSEEIVEQIQTFALEEELLDYSIILNTRRYGVLHHPWVGFEALFEEGFDFVVRAEDDLLVSTDVLEYLAWASEQFADRRDVAAVHSYSLANEQVTRGREDLVEVKDWFNPLIWGTWSDRWREVIRDTWDHDYSTFNGHPGKEAGWDWNLNTRVLPARGLKCAHPVSSRTQHIGVIGTHGTAENFQVASTFKAARPAYTYRVSG